MAFRIPLQDRAVDPYSSYHSNNANRLTRILSRGSDVIVSGLQVSVINPTTIEVEAGLCVKDDCLIHIKENVQISLTDDPNWYVEGGSLDAAGTYYICIQYNYAKVNPPNEAAIKILKTTPTGLNSGFLFLKAITISSSQIVNATDFDPSDHGICRQYSISQAAYAESLPNWSSAQEGVLYHTASNKLVIGGSAGWIEFQGTGTSISYALIEHATSLPVWNSSYTDYLYVINDTGLYLGGQTQWIDVGGGGSAGVTVRDITGLVTVPDVTTIRVTNGTLTNEGGGTVTIQTGGSTATSEVGDYASILPILNFVSDSGIFSATVNHGLNADPVIVHMYDNLTNLKFESADIQIINADSFKIWMPVVPANPVRVRVIPGDGDNGYVNRYTTYNADTGRYSVSVVHGLSSDRVVLQAWGVSTKEMIYPADIQYLTATTSKLWFDSVPTQGIDVIACNYGSYTQSSSSYAAEGGGQYSVTFTHGLDTLTPAVDFYNDSTDEIIVPEQVEITSSNTVKAWYTGIPGFATRIVAIEEGEYSTTVLPPIPIVEHNQTAANTTWVINYAALGHVYPIVQVMEDAAGSTLDIASPTSINIDPSTSTVTVTFGSATTGKVWIR